MVDGLIDKQDNSEIIRDQICAILATEIAAQVQLAIDNGIDPETWDIRVYCERHTPWDIFRVDSADQRPVVNVYFDSATYDKSQSNVIARQKANGVYTIDCYAVARTVDTVDGHIPADKAASESSQSVARIIRNIIMGQKYRYLGLRKTVWGRWIANQNIFHPQDDGDDTPKIVATRLSLEVGFNERSPQDPGFDEDGVVTSAPLLEEVSVTADGLFTLLYQ